MLIKWPGHHNLLFLSARGFCISHAPLLTSEQNQITKIRQLDHHIKCLNYPLFQVHGQILDRKQNRDKHHPGIRVYWDHLNYELKEKLL